MILLKVLPKYYHPITPMTIAVINTGGEMAALEVGTSKIASLPILSD